MRIALPRTMDEFQKARTQQHGRPKSVGSDGSALDNLPADVMDPEAMRSLDQYLERLTDFDSRQVSAFLEPTASISATSTATVTPTTARAAPSSSTMTPTTAGAKASEPSLTPIVPYGDESSSFPNLFAADRSDDVYADNLLQDALDSDGDAHADGFKSHEPEASGGAAGYPAKNEAGDEQDTGEENRQVTASNKGGSKRKKGDRKRAREGEIASEAQKQKASRDRNREHARNTRIRKKQYVENLKTQIGELLQMKTRAERDTLLLSSKASTELQHLRPMHSVPWLQRATRRQMVLNMFYLRATEDLSRRSWATILDEGFTCIVPLTPYRHFPSSEVREDHRFITGIDGMIQDTASLAVFIQSICRRSQNPTGQKVNYQFYTSPEDTVVGSDSLMCRWLMKTENAAECGAQCEVFSQGMLRARFAPDHRITRLELVFDVMGFMQQLQRAMGGGGFRATPNTLESAMQASRQARLVCSSEPPYWIAHANEAWTALTGHSAEQAKLFPLNLVNGAAGSAEVNNVGDLDGLVQTCVGTNLKRTAMADVRIVTRNMSRLTVSVLCCPLGAKDGNTTHVLLVMEEVPICPALPQPGLDLFPFA